MTSAVRAYYYYARLDKVTDKFKTQYVDANVPKEFQNVAVNIFLITSAIKDSKVHYIWSF